MLPVRRSMMLEHRWQVPERPAAVLAEYRNAVARARSDDEQDLALARQFVLPGRCMNAVGSDSLQGLNSSPVSKRRLQMSPAHLSTGRASNLAALVCRS
jgi:hypothetical protein